MEELKIKRGSLFHGGIEDLKELKIKRGSLFHGGIED